MADAHVFWQLDGSIRVMVYTLVVAHVGALVCSTTTNPSPPIGHATPTGGRYSGACPSARGRRPMQRSRDDTGGSRCAVHASPGSTWRTRLLRTVGRERCSRWRVLACGCACVLCHVSRLRRYIGVKTATSLPRTHCRVRALVSSAVAVPFGPSPGSRVLECRRALSFWPHAAARTPAV